MKHKKTPEKKPLRFPVIGNLVSRILAAVLLSVALPALAEHDSGGAWQQTTWSNDHVIVFSECGYNGLSKAIPIGDYPRLGEIGIRNNDISSVIIPAGMAIEIFQRRGFRGHWYRINQNQICLKGNWNDRIGAMRVVQDIPGNSYGFSEGYDDGPDSNANNCHPFTVYAGRSDGGIRFVDEENTITPVQAGRKLEGNLCRKGSVRLELAKRDRGGELVLQIGDLEYKFEPWSQYDDFRDRWYRRYINIDLPKLNNRRDNIVYGANGWGDTPGFGKRFSSGVEDGGNWGNNYRRDWNRKVAKNTSNTSNKSNSVPPSIDSTSTSTSNNCTSYSVSGNHGDVGVRFFAGDNQFHLTGRGTKNLQLCHSGSIRFELAKKKEASEVMVRIAGREYRFRAGERGDRFANNWYRKYFRIDL